MFLCAHIHVSMFICVCVHTCHTPFLHYICVSKLCQAEGRDRFAKILSQIQHFFFLSFLTLPSWLYNWEGQLSCVLQKRKRTRQRVRTLWTTETYVMSETRTSEEQQDGDSTGGRRWEEECESESCLLKREGWKMAWGKRVHGRKKSRKSRFIMEKIWISTLFQQRKQEIKSRLNIVLFGFYHHLTL